MNDFMRDIDAGTRFVKADTASALRAIKAETAPRHRPWIPVALLRALPLGIRHAAPLLAATTVAAAITVSASVALTHRTHNAPGPATSANVPVVALSPSASSPASPTPGATPTAISNATTNQNSAPLPIVTAPQPTPAPTPSAGSTYVSSVLNTPGLVSFWRLGETSGGSAQDSKGSNSGAYQSGTTLGVAGLVPNDSQTAVQTGTSAGGVLVPNSSSLSMTGQVSVEAWIKPTAAEANEIFVDKQSSYRLRFDSTGRLSFGVYLNGTEHQVLAPAGLPLNAVSHVVGTYDGSMLSLYVNGTLINSVAASGAVSVSTSGLGIGYNGGSIYHFGGDIQDVAIYNVALNQQQASRT